MERRVRTRTQEAVWRHQSESFEAAEPVILGWIEQDRTERQLSALDYFSLRAWREQAYHALQAASAWVTVRGAYTELA